MAGAMSGLELYPPMAPWGEGGVDGRQFPSMFLTLRGISGEGANVRGLGRPPEANEPHHSYYTWGN